MEWNEASLRAQKQTKNTRLKLVQHKWLTRVYITPVTLNQMFSNIPETYTKCQNDKGTLIHCLWECPKILKDSELKLSNVCQKCLMLRSRFVPNVVFLEYIQRVLHKQTNRLNYWTFICQMCYCIMLEKYGCSFLNVKTNLERLTYMLAMYVSSGKERTLCTSGNLT